MRIAILTNAFPPDAKGGAGRIAGVYAELLKQKGHEIHVWGPSDSFSNLSSMSMLRRLFFHVADLKERRHTVEQIVEWKPDALLTHNLTGCGFGTPRAICSRGIRWVHVLHDVQLIEPSGAIIAGESMPFVRKMWRCIWSSLRHRAMSEPDAVASPTAWLLEFHRTFGWFTKVRFEVIPNPVGAHAMRPSDRPYGGRVAHAPTSNVLFVGRLDWDKGIDLMIETWNRIRDIGTKLVLIGEGSWKERIVQLNDASIELRGQQSVEQVEQAMRESAVVVMPSRIFENQPTVILEAAAADCRIVVADVGGVRETVGNAGTIVPPNDVVALSVAIRQALTNPFTEEETQRRRMLVSRHDPDAAVGALIGLLTSNL